LPLPPSPSPTLDADDPLAIPSEEDPATGIDARNESLAAFLKAATAITKPAEDAARIRVEFEEPLRKVVAFDDEAARQLKAAQSSKDSSAAIAAIQALDKAEPELIKLERFYRTFHVDACSDPTFVFPTATASPPPARHNTTPAIHYLVRRNSGEDVPIVVRYRLPSGEFRTVTAKTPWTGPAMTFHAGEEMYLEAAVAGNAEELLACVFASVDHTQGAYAGGRVTHPSGLGSSRGPEDGCDSQYELGAWPPPEDDPERGNLMIRVG
jgi:hypothetical protein